VGVVADRADRDRRLAPALALDLAALGEDHATSLVCKRPPTARRGSLGDVRGCHDGERPPIPAPRNCRDVCRRQNGRRPPLESERRLGDVCRPQSHNRTHPLPQQSRFSPLSRACTPATRHDHPPRLRQRSHQRRRSGNRGASPLRELRLCRSGCGNCRSPPMFAPCIVSTVFVAHVASRCWSSTVSVRGPSCGTAARRVGFRLLTSRHSYERPIEGGVQALYLGTRVWPAVLETVPLR